MAAESSPPASFNNTSFALPSASLSAFKSLKRPTQSATISFVNVLQQKRLTKDIMTPNKTELVCSPKHNLGKMGQLLLVSVILVHFPRQHVPPIVAWI